MPFNLGFGEILIVLVVALLVFGGRLPEVARSVGQGIREFKDGLKAGPDDEDEADEWEARPYDAAADEKPASDEKPDPPAS